ncbi:MAG: glycosyltransferase [Candidatus Bathyarchaeia archaeon]|nr:glycosyltransferase [Candidatus Bathyarchaeota archaeon]
MREEENRIPKVSVIIPVKNGAAKIKDLLDSLMQVDYDKDKLEIIVVDGDSTDGTKEIVSKYPVRLLVEKKPGVNTARNTGIKNSTGEIIAFTDHDCVVPKDWIKKIVENLQDSEVGCVGGQILRYGDDFFSRYADESIIPVMRIFKKEIVLNKISSPAYYPVGCNFAVKREAVEKTGFFDERFEYGFDELEFAERVCEKGYKILLTPEITVKHKHRSSFSELIKQAFRYGQGGGLVPKIKGVDSILSIWVLFSIAAFSLWFFVVLSLTIYIVLTWSTEFLSPLLALLFFPIVGLMALYAYRTFHLGDGMYMRILAYPFVDVARSLAFVAGVMQRLLKPAGHNASAKAFNLKG